MSNTIVEVCCGSAEDAIRAYKAGAHRIELNSALLVGGLTPSVGMLTTVKKFCDVPVICMVRPRPGGFCYSDLEFETMLEDAKILTEFGADGLAFGFLDEKGLIDVERCKTLASIAKKEAVFHRAFDTMTEKHNSALEKLISAGVTRILTSGGEKTAEEGVYAIKSLVKLSNEKIQILPGGSIRGHNVHDIMNITGCSQVHLSFHMDTSDPSVNENSKVRFLPTEIPDENVVRIIDELGLKNFINSV